MKNKKLKSTGRNVLIEPIKRQKDLEIGGVLIPENINDYSITGPVKRGKVISVGPGFTNGKGIFFPTELKEGDVVLYVNGSGGQNALVEIDETTTYLRLKEYEILAVIEED